jgi:gas vesicle protein
MADQHGCKGKGVFVGAVIGGLVGAAATLLLTRKETREDLLNGLAVAKELLKEQMGDVAERAVEVKGTASEKWIDLKEAMSKKKA